MPSVFVLCHTILYDALGKEGKSHEEHKTSARELMSYFIENIGEVSVFTSSGVIDSFISKLPYSYRQEYEFTELLRSFIKTINTNDFDINEAVIILADIISSLPDKQDGVEVILVTNMPKKVRYAIEFYQKSETGRKKWTEEDIPFRVINSSDLMKELSTG